MEPKVDRVIIAFPAPATEGNDSNFDFSSPPSVQLRPMYDYLVGVNPETGAFEPQLASEWSVEPDGLGIRFKLREGIQFHNGWASSLPRTSSTWRGAFPERTPSMDWLPNSAVRSMRFKR